MRWPDAYGVSEVAALVTSDSTSRAGCGDLTEYRKMQHIVRLHPPHIVAIEQPVQLLAGQCHNVGVIRLAANETSDARAACTRR